MPLNPPNRAMTRMISMIVPILIWGLLQRWSNNPDGTFKFHFWRTLFLRFRGEEERITLALAQFGRLLGLGLSDVAGEHRDHAGAALVRRHHHPVGLAFVHPEHRLQHLHDELARRVVVVEQD